VYADVGLLAKAFILCRKKVHLLIMLHIKTLDSCLLKCVIKWKIARFVSIKCNKDIAPLFLRFFPPSYIRFCCTFQALYFGGEENLPLFLARHGVFGIVVDPCAAALVIIATILLCCGIKEVCLKTLEHFCCRSLIFF